MKSAVLLLLLLVAQTHQWGFSSSEDVKDKAQEAKDQLKNKAQDAKDNLKDKAQDAKATGQDTLDDIKDRLNRFCENNEICSSIKDYSGSPADAAKAYAHKLRQLSDELTEAGENKMGEGADKVKENVHGILSRAQSFWDENIASWMYSASEMAGKVKDYVEDKAENLKDGAYDKMADAKEYAGEDQGPIHPAVDDYPMRESETAESLKEQAKNKAYNAKDYAEDTKDSLKRKASDAASTASDKLKRKASDAASAAGDKYEDSKDTLKRKASDAASAAGDKYEDVKENIKERAADAKDAMADKMSGTGEYIADKAKRAAKATLEAMEEAVMFPPKTVQE